MKYKVGDMITDSSDGGIGIIVDEMPVIKNSVGGSLKGPWFKVFWTSGPCLGWTTEHKQHINQYKKLS
tara:strand:+ start:220 stop:423 length:204 start_codon:yes stop_codon:yes gene_type:complete